MSLIGKCAPVEETIHGAQVCDPYRWLEDRNLPETKEWIREQHQRCENYFAQCEELPAIRQRVRKYCDVEVIDQPAKIGSQYFYRRRPPGLEQASIYIRDAIDGSERVLVDPSVDGPFVSVGIYRVSSDGSMLAYQHKHGGEDKSSIHIVDVRTRESLPCALERGYPRGFAFSPERGGFYYCHETSDKEDHLVGFQSFDVPSARSTIFRVARSRDSRLTLLADTVYLAAIRFRELRGDFVADLWISERRDPTNWLEVFTAKRMPLSPTLAYGRLFVFTYDNRSHGKLIELTVDGNEARTILEDEGAITRQLTVAGDSVYLCSSRESRFTLKAVRLNGEPLPEIVLPDEHTVELLPNLGDGSSLFLSSESFTSPPTLLEYIPNSRALFAWTERQLPRATVSITTRHTSYSSIDGTDIPITFAGDLSRNEMPTVPIIMTSDGGFGVPLAPRFSILASLLMECGAVFAIPHIRGSGTFGNAWHIAGRSRSRQRSFDDFIAAGDWLCREGTTTPQQIALFGASNAGLLVAVALTQRPDLCRAVLCISPLLDMVRYEHFDQARNWKDEYGTCDDEEDFRTLYSYSPYHHVSANVQYPSVLFVAGDRDDRCNPAHVRKMAAHLLGNGSRSQPVIVDYSTERGHVPVMPLSVKVEALARRVAFLCRELGLPFPRREIDDTASR